MRKFVPSDLSWFSVWRRAPSPIPIVAMTHATPMMIPSAVRSDRSLLRARARKATFRMLPVFVHAGFPAATARLRSWTGDVAQDLAVAERDDAPGELRDVGLVRDEDDGLPLVVQGLEDRHDLLRRPRVEVARRLVREEDRRLVHEAPRDRDPLLLAARELGRRVVPAVREADALEAPQRPRARLRVGELRLLRVEERQLDVLERRRAREEVEVLEDEADLVVPDLGARVASERRHVDAVENVAVPTSAGRGSRRCS